MFGVITRFMEKAECISRFEKKILVCNVLLLPSVSVKKIVASKKKSTEFYLGCGFEVNGPMVLVGNAEKFFKSIHTMGPDSEDVV